MMLLGAEKFETSAFLQSMQKALQNGADTRGTIILLSLLLGVPLIVTIVYRVAGWRKAKRAVPPSRYLTLAVDVIGLPEDTRRDLLTVARLAKLEQPASLLLSPANFALATEQAIQAGAGGDPELRTRLSSLHAQLFGAPLAAPA